MSRTINDGNRKRRSLLEVNNRLAQLDRIYKRDKGICQICFKPCTRTDASRDHIKEFRYCNKAEAQDDNNIRLAHANCNNRRSDVRKSRLSQSLADFMPIELLKIMDLL